MRYNFGDKDASPSTLTELLPTGVDTAFVVEEAQALRLQSALDADTTGILHIDVVINLRAEVDPAASDTFNVSGWHEAKAELQAAC